MSLLPQQSTAQTRIIKGTPGINVTNVHGELYLQLNPGSTVELMHKKDKSTIKGEISSSETQGYDYYVNLTNPTNPTNPHAKINLTHYTIIEASLKPLVVYENTKHPKYNTWTPSQQETYDLYVDRGYDLKELGYDGGKRTKRKNRKNRSRK
jgi:hypothetical protein